MSQFESAMLRVPLDPDKAKEALPLIRSLCDEMEAVINEVQIAPGYMASVIQSRTWQTMSRINSLTTRKKKRDTK